MRLDPRSLDVLQSSFKFESSVEGHSKVTEDIDTLNADDLSRETVEVAIV